MPSRFCHTRQALFIARIHFSANIKYIAVHGGSNEENHGENCRLQRPISFERYIIGYLKWIPEDFQTIHSRYPRT